MSCYISSNANRLYAALESNYGQAPAITAANRIAAVKLTAKQSLEKPERRDKTGSRTFPGYPAELRKLTNFSLTIYGYWIPATAVQRILAGVAMNQFRLDVNGDYHQFEFSGPAQDLIDNASFESGEGALSSFPTEPAPAAFNYSIIPGHLGEV